MNTFRNIFRWQNIGTIIFFILNFGSLVIIFSPAGFASPTFFIILCLYILSVLIFLSPFGEWVISVFAGAKEMKRKDMQIRMIPLIEIVYNRAKKEEPHMVNSIRLKIIQDPTPNAYALGRKTICVTEGLFALPDDLIMGILAHEMGHLAYRNTEVQLIIGGANFLISVFLLFIKLIAWTITGIFGLIAIGMRKLSTGCLIGLIGSFSTLLVFLWTKFCMLFLMWSARKNEFLADKFAWKIGFGEKLAAILDLYPEAPPKSSFIRAFYKKHPNSSDRIARLQELGVNYSRWQFV